ncbi:carboxymuconolactone decarboxylase family protein [Nocardioides sp. KIGAM211]|uniref:Carboxymuconolactone decarboxylase family protein n=1 Tax=Nocardioides luti TaxID=2761101 RepID=A0A7X0V924_9ACTN|nr:carboxymuconolactone decarboxylase family protein [Nocardioides luti]MBB6626156.1 carboxymuconolactone decarboxylase family protein [Nocardioides luti]
MSADEPVRIGMPEDGDLTDAQRAAVERITAGPRGGLVGPFVPLLRSPELMTRLQLVGEHLRFGSVLDDDLFELTVLVVARHWHQQFEWGFHQPLAAAKGVPPSVTDDVAAGRRPASGRPELALVADLARALLETGQVDDASYAAALAALGEERLVEVVVTVGYYTTLALTMNLARTPAPDGAPRLEDPPEG